mgnify:CR=1 FL=1
MTAPHDPVLAERLQQRLLIAAEVREIDARAVQAGVSGAALMARAGASVAQCAQDMLRAKTPRSARVAVLCGPGKNGGDGFVAARLLAGRGYRVDLWDIPPAGDPAQEVLEATAAWTADHPTLPLADAATDGSALPNADLVIDALFGVGLTRALTGEPATIARLLRSRGSPPVLSVDIPSGVCSDTGIVRGEAFQATRTVTFVAPKLGHFLGDGALLAGDLTVAQIGAPPSAINAALENSTRPVTLATPSVFAQPLTKQTSIKPTLAKQRPDAHKYDYGHAVVASGGLGASGAARLAAHAALRVGAGLVTVAAPQEAVPECAAHLTSVMLRETAGLDDWGALLSDPRVTSLALGPGMSRGRGANPSRTCEVVEAVLAGSHPTTVVLDADALTCWSSLEHLADAIRGSRSTVVLTPHFGEFRHLFPDLADRLTQQRPAGLLDGKADMVLEASKRSGATVLLKGMDTVIAAPWGEVTVHSAVRERAAPQIATAGAGDVLTGVIAGLGARGWRAFDAACAAAWLHVEAARAVGLGLIAEDLPDALPAAMSAADSRALED